MNNKAQAALEYLMTYGWALIIIATIFGVLVFIAIPPTQSVSFSSSEPEKIMVKGSNIENNIVTIILQNITGGEMRVSNVDLDGSFSFGPVTLNGEEITDAEIIPPIEVEAGGELYFTGIGYSGSGGGTIDMEYTDFSGLVRTLVINGTSSGGSEPACPIACEADIDCDDSNPLTTDTCNNPGTCDAVCSNVICLECCGNDIAEAGEACDGTDVGSNMTCLEDCSGATITGCTTITRTGTYTVGNNISTSGSDCITIQANNTILNCVGKNLTSSNGYKGITVNEPYDYATIQNCNLYNWESGIYLNRVDNATIQSSSIYMNSNSNKGIHAVQADDITIDNCYIELFGSLGIGIYLDETYSATITGCNIYDHEDTDGVGGIYTDYCDDTTISDTSIGNFDNYGIYAYNESGIMIKNVNLTNNDNYGIYILGNGTIKNNIVTDSATGIYAKGTGGLLYMDGDNVTSSQNYGIYLAGTGVRFGNETSCNNGGPDLHCEAGGTYETDPSGETHMGRFVSDGSCAWSWDNPC